MAIQGLASGHIKAAQPQQQITKMEERLRVLESMEMRGRDEVVRVPAEIELALGSAYFRQQKLAEAEKAYAAAVKANGKLGAAHNNLAVIYMLTGRYPEAHASIAAAEAAGFLVPARLKADLKQRESAAAPE
jgi:Tfp pilus assembly protein PilF